MQSRMRVGGGGVSDLALSLEGVRGSIPESPALRRGPGIFEKVLGSARGFFTTRLGIRTCVLAVEGNLLVLELETPSDGFVWPEGLVEVEREGQQLGVGAIDPGQSSPQGPHPKGLLLRLAVLGPLSWTCRIGDEVWITGGMTA